MVQFAVLVAWRATSCAQTVLAFENGAPHVVGELGSSARQRQELEGLGAQHSKAFTAILQRGASRTCEEPTEYLTDIELWTLLVDCVSILFVPHPHGVDGGGSTQGDARTNAALV